MSVRCSTWAWDQSRAGVVDGTNLLVLLALADQANDDGHLFVRLEIIQEMTGRSDKTVRRACEALEALGLMDRERRRRRSGTWGTYDYWLRVHEQPLLRAGHQRSKSTSGQDDRWRAEGAGQRQESGGMPECPGVGAALDHRSNETTGQNDQWPEMTGRPPVTGDRAVTRKTTYPTNQPPRVCAREAEAQDLVVFDCGGGQALAYGIDDIPDLKRTFPSLTAEQIEQTLREIGAWYHGECADPDNPRGRRARLPHEWKSLVRRWLSETQGRASDEHTGHGRSAGGFSKTAEAVAILEGERRGG